MKNLILLALTFLHASIFAQSLNPVSLEQLVNTDVPSNQYCPVIASDDQGNYMVFWTMGYYSGSIKARRFNNNHVPVSEEITINSENSKALVANYWENGKFVLSYIENSSNYLRFVVINADNSIGPEIDVLNNIESFDMDVNGNTLVFAYTGTANNAPAYLRGYDLNAGTWINTQVLVSETSNADHSEPNVIIHPDGRMTVVFYQYILVSGCCDYYRNIMRKSYTANFLAEAPQQTIWYVDSEYNVTSDLEAEGNANGEVLITTTHGTVFSSRHMRIWIVSSTGSLIVNNDEILTSGGYDWYDNVESIFFDNGDFVISKSIRTGGFSNPNQNEAYVLYGSNYNESNTGLLQLNSTASGEQEYVALAELPGNGFVTAWAGNGFQGDAQGIYSRAYNAIEFPGFNIQNTNYQVNESGSTSSIPVVLNTQPTANVTISLSNSNTSELSASPSTLTFTPSNWNTPQLITIQGENDDLDDGNSIISLTFSANSTDPDYNNLTDISIAVTNLDDDATFSNISTQEICQLDGLQALDFTVSNNGGAITNVYATSSNQLQIDDADIEVLNVGNGDYTLSINNLSDNNLGVVTLTIIAQDDNFNYTSSFDVEIQGVELTIISQDQSICEGETATLSASGASSISWSNGVVNNVPFAPQQTADYTVTASNGGACLAEGTVTITVNEYASSPVIEASATEICAGESIILSVTGNDTYTWDKGVENGVAFVPDASTTYTVVASNGTGCNSSSSIEIVLNELPNAPQILATSQEICSGTGVTLLALGNLNLSWDNGVENNVEFFPTETTVYTVTGNNGSSCTASTSIEIVVNPSPEVPTITLFNGSLVSSAINGNQWYLNGNPIDGATNQIYSYSAVGNYTVEVTLNGCSSVSEEFGIILSLANLQSSVNVFPNPATDYFTLSGYTPGTRFNLLDAFGKLVLSCELNAFDSQIDITRLSSGVYMGAFIYKNTVLHTKIIKQ